MNKILYIEDIQTLFPNEFGIKEKLRQDMAQNPEFLTLTLQSYDLYLCMQN